ncbi:hypothetical protein BD289DRAFT_423373 [Coniella lustricola]|uniref:FAD-binding FR-type domain-containing protein n=1 Tax=Coniella lustricola TaxID=2025994 RepID=A0A2T3AJS8_9PEZI|nr:hypothetical protein BD289DRAFT_423373 [Coniella lustricola]
MPCPVISNEPAGHDAFILTIQTPLTALMQTTATRTNCHVVDEAWRHGLWSVEVKQPQLQIARNYTPLPPTSSVKDGAADSNRSDPEQQRRIDAGIVPLSFYIRRYDGGEVSTYLSRMQPGDLVEIRGPHLGFDLAARLGEAGKKVVFLAGGTGIAPALQAASRLLDSGLAPTSSDDGGRDDAHLITTPSPTSQVQDVTILWANRSAVACAGCERLNKTVHSSRGFWSWMGGRQSSSDPSLDPSSDTSPTQPSEDANREPSSAIMQQLYALQLAYERQGRTLQVRCVVDEEGSRITANDIANVVSKHSHINKDTTSRGQVAAGSLQNDSSTTCHLHTQRRLEHATESDDAANNGAGILDLKRCDCTRQGFGGKNLFMICGPDGFVSAYVGPKVWADGAERQGRIGGVVAELIKKNPQMWKDWLVLKQ